MLPRTYEDVGIVLGGADEWTLAALHDLADNLTRIRRGCACIDDPDREAHDRATLARLGTAAGPRHPGCRGAVSGGPAPLPRASRRQKTQPDDPTMTHHTSRLSDWLWRGAYLMWPLTYAILVYDDLTHHETWTQRLLPIFTLDVLFAAVWPAMWIYWIVQGVLHHSTALTRLLGL